MFHSEKSIAPHFFCSGSFWDEHYQPFFIQLDSLLQTVFDNTPNPSEFSWLTADGAHSVSAQLRQTQQEALHVFETQLMQAMQTPDDVQRPFSERLQSEVQHVISILPEQYRDWLNPLTLSTTTQLFIEQELPTQLQRLLRHFSGHSKQLRQQALILRSLLIENLSPYSCNSVDFFLQSNLWHYALNTPERHTTLPLIQWGSIFIFSAIAYTLSFEPVLSFFWLFFYCFLFLSYFSITWWLWPQCNKMLFLSFHPQKMTLKSFINSKTTPFKASYPSGNVLFRLIKWPELESFIELSNAHAILPKK